MDINLPLCDHADEDYIDMEVGSSSNFCCYSINSPPYHREFEFQMSSTSLERETTTAPADELFYKGSLLPLHLPPRLQMVEELLHNTNEIKTEAFEELYSTFFATTTASTTTTTTTTPFESCKISPSDSCRVSRELNPDEYYLEFHTEESGFLGDHQKKFWSKKLKMIKQSLMGFKTKASQVYLKSLFSKSGSSDEFSDEATRDVDGEAVSKIKDCLNKCMKMAKKNPFGQIQKDRHQMSDNALRGFHKEKTIEDNGGGHRRSFSGAIKRHSANKSSSSSSSSGSSSSSFLRSSNGFSELQLVKRSSNANSEFESSIQGAIAHCKQSQQSFCSRKTVSEAGFCPFSASRIAASEDQERPGACRG